MNTIPASEDTSFTSLLANARHGNEISIGKLLRLYQNYLSILASTQYRQRLNPRVAPSDIVQDTLLRAYKNFGQFRGSSKPEFLAWLRQILVNSLAQFVEKHILAERRDVRREVSIEQMGRSMEHSTIRLAKLIPAEVDSPSRALQQAEDQVQLADILATLPRDYQTVLALRNLQELSFEEVAKEMDRSVGATRMLWLRAIEKLRLVYKEKK